MYISTCTGTGTSVHVPVHVHVQKSENLHDQEKNRVHGCGHEKV
jgi:hypothetical protein